MDKTKSVATRNSDFNLLLDIASGPARKKNQVYFGLKKSRWKYSNVRPLLRYKSNEFFPVNTHD